MCSVLAFSYQPRIGCQARVTLTVIHVKFVNVHYLKSSAVKEILHVHVKKLPLMKVVKVMVVLAFSVIDMVIWIIVVI